jgi:hypothetical protein
VFRWGNLSETHHLKDLGIDGSIILKWIFKRRVGGVWTGSIWLRTEISGRLLCMW